MLQGLAAFSASALFSGCAASLTNSSTAGAATSSNAQATTGATPQVLINPQPVPDGPFTQASLTLSATTTGAIGSGFAGLSYEKSSLYEPLFTASNTELIGMFKRLGPSVLRIGGNSVDRNVWTPNGKGQTPGQIAPPDVEALAAFVKQTGWQCIYGINLGGAATGATTPELAAAEVAYAAEQFGSSLIGIEIGNECDGYGAAASYFAGNWSLEQFESLWGQFRAAIVAAAPGVPVTGPASGSNVSTWTVPFGEAATSNNISLLTQHYYRGNGQAATSTAANLLTPDTNLTNCLSLLSSGAKSAGVPFRLGECNSYFNGGATGVSDSYASALWVVDFLFNSAHGGAAGVNLHGGGDAGGYTPIADAAGVVVGARPEYYGMLLFTLAGQGALYQTQLSAGQLNATAYAVKTATGVNIVIVNKDATQNLELSLILPQVAKSATLMAMTQSSGGAAPSLAATSGVTIQGGAVDASGNFTPASPYNLAANSTEITCYVPALSAVLVQVV